MKKHVIKQMATLSTLFLLMCLSFALVSASTSFKSGSTGGLSTVTPPPVTFPQSTSVTSATISCPTMCGDAWMVGPTAVNINDVLYLYQVATGVLPQPAVKSPEYACGDVDNSGGPLDLTDAILVAQFVATGSPILTC